LAVAGEDQLKSATVVASLGKRADGAKGDRGTVKAGKAKNVAVQPLEHHATLVLDTRRIRLLLNIQVLQDAGVIVDLEDTGVEGVGCPVALKDNV
jgi:hypothetical protein